MDINRVATFVGGGLALAGVGVFIHHLTRGDDAQTTAEQLLDSYDRNDDGLVHIATEGTFEVRKDCKDPYSPGKVRHDWATHDGTKLLTSVDANNDGTVGVQELRPLVASWDVNGNGRVSLGERRDGSYAAGARTENVCPVGEA